MVTSFIYLGQVISKADDDWAEVVNNLSWARAVWRRMTRILSREGAAPQVSGLFFKALVQAVLLFVSEAWVVTPRMGKAWGGGSGLGGETFDGTATAEDTGRELYIHLEGNGKEGGGVLYNGVIHMAAPEHGCTLHCYEITVIPV